MSAEQGIVIPRTPVSYEMRVERRKPVLPQRPIDERTNDRTLLYHDRSPGGRMSGRLLCRNTSVPRTFRPPAPRATGCRWGGKT